MIARVQAQMSAFAGGQPLLLHHAPQSQHALALGNLPSGTAEALHPQLRTRCGWHYAQLPFAAHAGAAHACAGAGATASTSTSSPVCAPAGAARATADQQPQQQQSVPAEYVSEGSAPYHATVTLRRLDDDGLVVYEARDMIEWFNAAPVDPVTSAPIAHLFLWLKHKKWALDKFPGVTVAQAADPAFQAGVVGDFLREEHDRPRAFLDIPMLHANGLLFDAATCDYDASVRILSACADGSWLLRRSSAAGLDGRNADMMVVAVRAPGGDVRQYRMLFVAGAGYSLQCQSVGAWRDQVRAHSGQFFLPSFFGCLFDALSNVMQTFSLRIDLLVTPGRRQPTAGPML
jgi:hypothetical protein